MSFVDICERHMGLILLTDGKQRREAELPQWASAAKVVLLLQPSSAASERVFSILTTSFGHVQDRALQNYIECFLMLQFNKG